MNQKGIFTSITKREFEIVKLLLIGAKTNEIAIKLDVKSNTISTVKNNIYTKLKVENNIELFKLAIKEKVISFDSSVS